MPNPGEKRRKGFPHFPLLAASVVCRARLSTSIKVDNTSFSVVVDFCPLP